MPTVLHRSLRRVAILGLTAGLLAFFFWNADLGRVWAEMTGARQGLLAASVGVTGLVYFVRATRWQHLLRPLGRTRFRTAFRATVVGFTATFLLPARVGDVLRPYLLARQEGLSATATFATVLIERLLDLLTVLLLFGAFVVLFDPGLARADGRLFTTMKLGGLVGAVAALLGLGLVTALAGRPDRLRRLAARFEQWLPLRLARAVSRLLGLFAEGLAVLRHPRRLISATLLSLPLWLLIALGIWLVTEAFGIAMPFPGAFVIMALLVVGVAAPTPGAVGGFHAAFQVGATAFYGASTDQAVGAAIVLHAISFVPVSLAGIVFMAQDGLTLGGLRRAAHATPALTVEPRAPTSQPVGSLVADSESEGSIG